VSNARLLTEANGARHLVLREFLREEDEKVIETLMAGVTRDNYADFRYEGVDVGLATTYELFLLFKKMSTRLSDEEWKYYQVYLRNSLQSLIGFSRIHAQVRPDVVLMYSPQYGANGVCATWASQHGSDVFFVEGSSSNSERYKALRVWSWTRHGLVNPAIASWDAVRRSVTVSDVRRVTGHFEELLDARSFAVYSAPVAARFSVRRHFGIPDERKVLLATLSSFDEAYAAFVIGKFPARKVRSPVFRDQFEWIQSTIGRLAARKDVQFIIRVHPRDYPNKRDPRQSEQAALWEKMFAELPPNVSVNWPQDGISLYSMLVQVDAVVTGWSATGTEALAFGVPVVTYDRYLPSYPADIHFTGESEVEYFANIERALAQGHSAGLAVEALRWLAVSFSIGTVQVEPESPGIGVRWPRTLLHRALRRTINRVRKGSQMRRDARSGFSTGQDADRFYELIQKRDSSLYDAVARNVAVADSAPAVQQALDEVASRLRALVPDNSTSS
jgi:hypothetical protein